jgi:hypothetical protein
MELSRVKSLPGGILVSGIQLHLEQLLSLYTGLAQGTRQDLTCSIRLIGSGATKTPVLNGHRRESSHDLRGQGARP